ncbi:hypothetical protein PMAYCL1PPCAC_06064, partial [Pristionchus mayeri]
FTNFQTMIRISAWIYWEMKWLINSNFCRRMRYYTYFGELFGNILPLASCTVHTSSLQTGFLLRCDC